jgi:hypothetical protein
VKQIIENNGGIYAYRETERVFKKNEKKRGTTRVEKPFDVLDWECNLSMVPTGHHMVFDLKPQTTKRNPSKRNPSK